MDIHVHESTHSLIDALPVLGSQCRPNLCGDREGEEEEERERERGGARGERERGERGRRRERASGRGWKEGTNEKTRQVVHSPLVHREQLAYINSLHIYAIYNLHMRVYM